MTIDFSAMSNVQTEEDRQALTTSYYGSDELNKESFLRLLVAQLQNQDPMEPMDNHEFVAQLAQFSQLEQLMSANESIDNLYLATASLNNASMTQLLGRVVYAYSNEFHYDGEGDMTLHYDAESSASAAVVTIYDEYNDAVASVNLGAINGGEGEFVWDGKDYNGVTVEDGIYTFSVSASDSDGSAVGVTALLVGEMDRISYESGEAVPSVDGVDISIADILRVTTTDGGDD